jgi:hypothetical protein
MKNHEPIAFSLFIVLVLFASVVAGKRLGNEEGVATQSQTLAMNVSAHNKRLNTVADGH